MKYSHSFVKCPVFLLSPPSRGAWIEIPPERSESAAVQSPPHAGGVD